MKPKVAICALHTYFSSNTYSIEYSKFSRWSNSSQDTVVRTVTRRESGWLRNCGLITGRVRDFSLLQNVQTDPEAHPASYSMGIRDLLSQVQTGRLEPYHLPPASTKVKNAWSNTSTFLHAFVACMDTTLLWHYHCDLMLMILFLGDDTVEVTAVSRFKVKWPSNNPLKSMTV
jgi:hypothetical protein